MLPSEGSHQACSVHAEGMGSVWVQQQGSLWCSEVPALGPCPCGAGSEKITREGEEGKHFENGRMVGVGYNRVIGGKFGVDGAGV